MPQKGVDVCVELPDFADVLEESEQVLRKCFKQYQPEEVFLSFNGGKDCTVLLDITINVLMDIYKNNSVINKLKVLYIRTTSPFRELEAFVKRVEAHYGISLVVTEGEMKVTLQRILDEDTSLKACLMGTRRTDPHSGDLKFMQNWNAKPIPLKRVDQGDVISPKLFTAALVDALKTGLEKKTDSNWPQIMRVSPLLNWSYHQIWSYILRRQVLYCSLYDKGYTSVGSTINTWPNPALARDSGFGPAWELADGGLERAGRVPPTTRNQNGHMMAPMSRPLNSVLACGCGLCLPHVARIPLSSYPCTRALLKRGLSEAVYL